MPQTERYRALDPDRIVETIDTLSRRIAERFPASGLASVCADLTEIARAASGRAEALQRPNPLLRLSIAVLLAAGGLLLAYVLSLIEFKRGDDNWSGVLQGIEAAINTTVLVGAGAIFLFTLEGRWKREQVQTHLHELRSIVHVIDMHQLTKDPSTTLGGGPATASSPKRVMTPFELTRYLDYCSEMLSLTAKVAALYAQSSRDPSVISAVSDLSQLTTNLSHKIWQKIMILDVELREAAGAKRTPA